MDGSSTLAGFVVGAVLGLTGGGALMTPLLVLLFGISPTTAVGTDLPYAAITKTAGVGVHQRNRTLDWRVSGRLAAGSVPAGALALLYPQLATVRIVGTDLSQAVPLPLLA